MFATQIKNVLAHTAPLRRVFFPLFARFNPGDVTITHHYTGDRVRLHSFKHRGYWWSGKDREADTMRAFGALVCPGDTVFEVGAHIGYITLYFAQLVGSRGRVHAFEPGDNNLPYTRQNLAQRPQITLIEKSVGDHEGRVTFYLEDLTGQNNSLVQDYLGLKATEGQAIKAGVRPVTVDLVTLDGYAENTGIKPDFIKIDVEGAEYGVLAGATKLLEATRPRIMVETANEAADRVMALLGPLGYVFYRPDGVIARTRRELHSNTFCLHPERHAEGIRALGWPLP